jgi:GH25 family lysozyme M1 (1,4-beta-N-acetylmuramidase)
MREIDRKKQLEKRMKYAVCIIIGIMIGIIVGICIGVEHNKTTRSKPTLYTEVTYGVELPPGELANLIYENYWNYIKQSYIIVGDDRETCQLYKISSKVARHNYDLERFQMDDDGYMRYSDDNIKKAKLGIDVSGHQGTIDWDQVKEAGIQFAMIRLGYRGYTQGGLALDDNYVTNIETALESKMPVGVYFYTQAVSYEEGVEEAQYVLKNIADYKISYPVVIDTEKMEADGARANDISNEERTDAIVGFCDTIKDAGYTPMIYANRNWYAQNLDMDRLGDYQLWLAQYSNVPDFPYLFTGWQYTSEGSVPGISGSVDIDVWMK